jgi:hypothetical protein
MILLGWFATEAFAAEKSSFSSYAILAGSLASIVLFFWGVYKAVKTQKTVYTLAMLPFILLMVGMFFL